jgi:hemoglobin
MIIEYVRYRIPREQAGAFRDAYRSAAASLRAAPECLGWELSQCEEEPESWTLRITWTSTEAHLQGFRKGPHFPRFLELIRPYIPQIQEMRHYTPTEVRSDASVYEVAGGRPALERLAHEMHQKMTEDDLLGYWFSAAAPTHVPHLASWLVEVFGGPSDYTQQHGDIAPILARHEGLDIPETHRARFEQLARQAASELWPDQPDVVDTISAYISWGTHVAVANSKPDHVANPAAGVPRWSWDDKA